MIFPTSVYNAAIPNSGAEEEAARLLEEKGYDAEYVAEKDKDVDLNSDNPVIDELRGFSDNERALWIDASRELYSLFVRPQERRKGSLRGPQQQRFYEEDDFGSDLTMPPQLNDDEIGQWGVEFMGRYNYRPETQLSFFDEVKNMTERQQAAFFSLLQGYDKLPDGTWSGTKRMLGNLATSPSTYLGLGTLGTGFAARKAFQKLGKAGVMNYIRELLPTAIATGVESGAYASLDDAMRQQAAIAAEQQKEFDLSRNLVATGVGTVAGAGLGMGLPAAVQGGVKLAKGANNALGAVVDRMGGGQVLSSGVGPVPEGGARVEPAPVFFSAVSNAVDAVPMEKGTGDQMRAMIAKGEGVKAEEMAWTGLDDFLAGKKSVTKQEVRDYVDANQVQVEEVVKGAGSESLVMTQRQDEIERELGFLQQVPDSAEKEAKTNALRQEYAQLSDDIRARGDGDTKFGEYTLPGGENYREVVLTLPETRSSTISNAELARLDKLTDKRIANSLDGLTDAERDEYISLVGKREDKGQFRSNHFDEPNVLAHMRLNDRTGPNGERILFIEEIQSDWHQKGRKQGYKTPVPEMDEATQARFDQYKKYRSLYYDPRMGKSESIRGGDPGLTKEYQALENEFEQYIGNASKVPDAPLKKGWHEMSFRRVARMAAEEGYDAIAWTPGKVQAERYDLSKQIDELRYQKNDDGTFNIVPAKDGQTIQAEEFENLAENRLAEVVGQEVAEKIVKGEGVADSGTSNAQILRGVDLQVGGEGMKGFYDKMLKKYAEKWGKKFGSKVGVTKIARGYPEMADDLKLLDDLGVEATGSPHHEVWSMPVTKKMRDSVLKKGVPLFSAAGAAAATGAAMQDEKQPASERVF